MNRFWRPALAFCLIVAASLACGLPGGPSGPARTPAPGPAKDPSPTPQVFFQDAFETTQHGWNRAAEDNSWTDYGSGVYVIQVEKANTLMWANPSADSQQAIPKNVRIVVTATRQSGSENNAFGITCRVQDQDNFYFLVVSSDGYYAIGKMDKGRISFLGERNKRTMDRMESRPRAGQPLTIEAICRENMLTLRLNGKALRSLTDDTFKQGGVGLIAATFGEPNVEIHFDNFRAEKPAGAGN